MSNISTTITPATAMYLIGLLYRNTRTSCVSLALLCARISHDTLRRVLYQKVPWSRRLWESFAQGLVQMGGSLVIDDTSWERFTREADAVSWGWSSSVGKPVWGMQVVLLLWTKGKWKVPLGIRIWRKGGPSKVALASGLLSQAQRCGLQPAYVLCDSWYAAAENLKLIHRRHWTFFTTLKSNRLVSLSKAQGYIHLEEIEWTPERGAHGLIVKLKEVPFQVRLFKLVAPNGDIDWVITNDLDETVTAQVAEESSDVRWQVEELHRGLKQLTGSEKCQCRGARAQGNHLACCYDAWVSLKVKAQELGQTMYELRSSLFSIYLQAELRHPRIAAC
jgi:hypothetical protein